MQQVAQQAYAGECRGNGQESDCVINVDPVPPLLPGTSEGSLVVGELPASIPQELLAQTRAVDREKTDDSSTQAIVRCIVAAELFRKKLVHSIR